MKKFSAILIVLIYVSYFVLAGVDDTLSVKYDTVDYFVCANGFPAYYDAVKYDSAGLYFVENEDTAYYISVTEYPIYNDTIYDTIKNGNTYDKNGFWRNTEGTYTKRFRTVNGCDSIVTLCLTVYDDIQIVFPTAFTPLGNNNKIFTYWVSDTENLELESFEIYSRLGTCVFKTSKKEDFWDGKYQGTVCPSDLYLYRIYYRYKFTGRILYEKHGEVFLLK